MRRLLVMVVITIFALIIAACDRNEEVAVETEDYIEEKSEDTEISEILEEEVLIEESTLAMEHHTIQFDTGEVSIALPEGWTVERARGSILPFAVQTYNLNLISPQGVKESGIITLGRAIGGSAISDEEFNLWYTTKVTRILPRAVEEEGDFIEKEVDDGRAIYATFTDAALVGTTPPPDEWIYLSLYFANYNDGYLVFASLFTDELYSEYHKLMLSAVASMKISLEALPESMSVEEWEEIKKEPVVDLIGLNLLNHDLEDSEFLIEYLLESDQTGEQFVVSVVATGVPYREEVGHVIWNSGGIGMLYYLVSNQDILEILDEEVSRDILRMGRDGFLVSSDSHVRTSEDGRTAAFGLKMEIAGWPEAAYIYLIEEIPGSDYSLFLLFILFYHHWSEEDPEILEELSEHIGIDLMEYWPW